MMDLFLSLVIIIPSLHSFGFDNVRFPKSIRKFSSRLLMADEPSSAATVLRCMGLSKSYTGVPQFDDISITLGRGQRVGLIGVNGAGKSTLLRCLAGIDKADKGNVEVAQFSNVIYVDQDPDWQGIPAYHALFSGDEPYAKATRMYYDIMAQGDDLDNEKLTKAMEAMEESSAWDYETRGHAAILKALKTNIQYCMYLILITYFLASTQACP